MCSLNLIRVTELELRYSFLGCKYFILYDECLSFYIRYSSPSLLMQSNSAQLCNFWTQRKLQGGLILKKNVFEYVLFPLAFLFIQCGGKNYVDGICSPTSKLVALNWLIMVESLILVALTAIATTLVRTPTSTTLPYTWPTSGTQLVL